MGLQHRPCKRDDHHLWVSSGNCSKIDKNQQSIRELVEQHSGSCNLPLTFKIK